jgi:hypothetical protein
MFKIISLIFDRALGLLPFELNQGLDLSIKKVVSTG